MDKIKANKRNSKKNLNGAISKYPEKELFFFDESRFGTHSKVGHGWFKNANSGLKENRKGRKQGKLSNYKKIDEVTHGRYNKTVLFGR